MVVVDLFALYDDILGGRVPAASSKCEKHAQLDPVSKMWLITLDLASRKRSSALMGWNESLSQAFQVDLGTVYVTTAAV